MSKPEAGCLEHSAFFYRGLDDFLGAIVPYVAEGVDRGEEVFVATRADYLRPLAEALGEHAGSVRLENTFAWCPHPASRLPAFYRFVSDALSEGAPRVRLAGEPVWPIDRPELTREWQRYDSVLNAVLAPFPVSAVCLYDETNLDRDVLATARVTHPLVYAEGATPEFRPPEEFLPRWNHRLDPPPDSAARLDDTRDLAAARTFLAAEARRAGVDQTRTAELCLAANEILTNGALHAERASMTTWAHDHRFVCQIDNHGPALLDPIAGYRPPAEEGENGRGLWMARQLVDLLQIVPRDSASAFRLHVYL